MLNEICGVPCIIRDKQFSFFRVFQFAMNTGHFVVFTVTQVNFISHGSAFLCHPFTTLTFFLSFWTEVGGSVLSSKLETLVPQLHALLTVLMPLDYQYFQLKYQTNKVMERFSTAYIFGIIN